MHGPDTLEAVVKLSHRLVGGRTPDINDFVFSTGHEDRELRVENDRSYALNVSIIKGVDTLAGLVIPNLY